MPGNAKSAAGARPLPDPVVWHRRQAQAAGYSFSDADYGQNNFAVGLPVGLQYQMHGLQVGLARRFGKNVTAKFQYRFNYYDEPSSGDANNYHAHALFATLTFRFP